MLQAQLLFELDAADIQRIHIALFSRVDFTWRSDVALEGTLDAFGVLGCGQESERVYACFIWSKVPRPATAISEVIARWVESAEGNNLVFQVVAIWILGYLKDRHYPTAFSIRLVNPVIQGTDNTGVRNLTVGTFVYAHTRGRIEPVS